MGCGSVPVQIQLNERVFMTPKDYTETFIFYQTFYEQICNVPTEYQLTLFKAVIEYGLFGVIPDGCSEQEEFWLNILMPGFQVQIDASKKHRINGQKGGKANASRLTNNEEARLHEAVKPALSTNRSNVNINVNGDNTIENQNGINQYYNNSIGNRNDNIKANIDVNSFDVKDDDDLPF